MRAYIFLLAVPFVFVGCASNKYVPPSDGPLVTLTVPVIKRDWKLIGGFSFGGVNIAVKNEDGCGMFASPVGRDQEGNELVISVPADKDIFVSVVRNHGNASCHISSLFSPEIGSEYRLYFEEVGNYCVVSLLEKKASGVTEKVRLKKSYASSWDGVKVCDAKDKL
jgi:hypothetical protein